MFNNQSKIIQIGHQKFHNVNIDDLKPLTDLGSGGFGTVSKRQLGNNILAVKEIKKHFGFGGENPCMELEVLTRTKNEKNIITYYGYISTLTHIYILMETMAMCLDKLYKNYMIPQKICFNECVLGKIAVFVVEALRYLLKELNVVHRDIKPANILIDWNGTIKISDFGVAEDLSNSFSCGGTVAYRCYGMYGASGDIWALGITLFELATLKYPYLNKCSDPDPYQTKLSCFISTEPSPELPATFSVEFQEFVAKCLEKKLSLRPQYADLVDLPWYQRHFASDLDLCLWLLSVLDHSTL